MQIYLEMRWNLIYKVYYKYGVSGSLKQYLGGKGKKTQFDFKICMHRKTLYGLLRVDFKRMLKSFSLKNLLNLHCGFGSSTETEAKAAAL